jgi:glycosyltransferase involved in cell wall biosynthesis
MHIWLVQPGEPLPIDAGHPRMLRTGMLAAELIRRGHRVTWWATTFRHATKVQRASSNAAVDVAPNYRIMLLRSPGYTSNISLRRLVDHRVLGRRYRDWARREEVPDLIHCSFPTIELAYETARYAADRALPWVIDARDMWPDIYVDSAPGVLKPVVRALLRADFRMTREAFRAASAITAHAPGFVDWGLAYAGRPRSSFDRDFPFAYAAERPSDEDQAAAERFWSERGLFRRNDEFIICFFGTFAARREVDLQSVILAARELRERLPRVKFVLCGAGPAVGRYEALARDLPNVLMPGWVSAPQIWSLMRRSQLGLLPYLPSADFAASMPNKSIEYLSAGLAILTSLRGGYLEDVLTEAGCGVFYEGESPTALAAVIERTVEGETSLTTLGAAAHALFESRYRRDIVFNQMVDHLERLAANWHSPAGLNVGDSPGAASEF